MTKPLTEGEIKAAQAVIERVMTECKLSHISFSSLGISSYVDASIDNYETELTDIYINRLHKLNGTEPPPF